MFQNFSGFSLLLCVTKVLSLTQLLASCAITNSALPDGNFIKTAVAAVG